MDGRQLLSRALVTATIWVSGSPSHAVPPPPPKQADLRSLQSYILGLDQGRSELYASALADDVNVTVADRNAARSKSEWMNSVLSRFTRGFNQNVTVEHVYYGGSQSAAGDYENKAILMERINRMFGGDCCIYNRVEVVTFRRDGLIRRIDRSDELNLELKPDGHRQDDLPGTP